MIKIKVHSMALEIELETYRAKLPELTQHEGKFVLVHGNEIVDFFTAYEDAIKAGYQKFKLEPFLVKQINAIESIHWFTRPMIPHVEPHTVENRSTEGQAV
jgi:hypothetical protein